ncbi:MAG: hypothetical protein L0229_13460 [Blastocatellia bacterium]|nr:hypothetical protein [Blastocatellia bacterium]
MNTDIDNTASYPMVTIDSRPTIKCIHSARWATGHRMIYLLRLSLAAVFFWFGILKVAGLSPVLGLLQDSFPMLAHSPYLELLGLGEMMIAAGLVVDRFANHASLLMVLHLVATLTVVLVSPAIVFAPEFPVLTMEGEFIAKNIVLITAGLVILSSRERQK